MADEAKKAKDEGKKAKKDKKKDRKDRGAWFREMRAELKKVVWPSRQTVAKNTGTVLACSFAVGACIWIFDFAATNVVKMILTIFGG